MLARKRSVIASLLIAIVSASLMLISPVKALCVWTPPYNDMWTFTGGQGEASADADLYVGNMTVYADWWGVYEVGGADAHVKVWKRVWLPATTLYIDSSWKLKGHYFSKFFTGISISLYVFIEESLNTGYIWQENLFRFYKDDEWYFEGDVDRDWTSECHAARLVEAGYYNIGAGFQGVVAGLDGVVDFYGVLEGGYGAWVGLTITDGESGGGGCPTLFVWNGSSYESEGTLNIHADSDITVQHEIQNTLALKNGVYDIQLRELQNNTSHIDQVKLYAVDGEGEWHLSPLIYAKHNYSYVTWKLLFDDEKRIDLTPTQIANLKFLPAIAYNEIAQFIFEIDGYNRKPRPW